MEALDGNSIAGLLVDVFGAEMTTVSGVCANCNTRRERSATGSITLRRSGDWSALRAQELEPHSSRVTCR